MLRDAPHCTATCNDGTPCQSPIVLASGRCASHDPTRRESIAAARQAGGRAKATSARLSRLMPATFRPVLNTLLDALGEVHDGKLEPPQANAMAALAGAIVKVYGAGQLEERLAALEEAAAGVRRVG